jgi:hypothetical protein
LLSVLALVLTFVLAPHSAIADNVAPQLSSPSSLSVTRAGATQALGQGAWINGTRVDLHFDVDATSGPVTPEVEVVPVGTVFTGTATAQGAAVSTSGTAVVPVQGLQNGTAYRWQARVVDSTGSASDWVPASASGTDFGVDLTSPQKPVITSPTNPRPSLWYHNRVITVRWTSQDSASGIAGYIFALQRGKAHGIKAAKASPAAGAHLSNLSDGVWFLALRSVDRAGNWSANAFFRVQIDRTPARVQWLTPRETFNPYNGPAAFKFSVTEPARVVLTLYRVGSSKPVQTFTYNSVPANKPVLINWAGKDGKHPLPKGYYYFSTRATDHAGNLTKANLGGVSLDPVPPTVGPAGVQLYPNGGKRIIVVLSQQTLYAYNGTHLDLKTYITSGNPALPTPTGTYTIMAKYHPYEMVSPWPVGSPYYYAPSWMQYAMLFRDGGYFLHDAPWRSVFGPGTNGAGQPGTNYGGTHGCVNVPPAAMTYLWNWSPMGTQVLVVS